MTEELRQLSASLEPVFPGAEIRVCEDRSPNSTAAPIHYVEVCTSGHTLRLAAKDLRWGSLVGNAAQVKPRFLHDPRREPMVYQTVLGPGLDTARHYATIELDGQVSWLILERLDAVGLDQIGDIGIWCRAARWLGAFHCQCTVPAPGMTGPLLVHDELWFNGWAARAREHLGSAIPGWLADYDAVAGRLASLPRTLVHGDHSAANVLASRDGRVCPVDWELAGIGTGVVDLAPLLAGWEGSTVDRLVTAYEAGAGEPVDRTDLALGRLHCCVQMVAWWRDLVQPADRRRDWLADAETLAMDAGIS